MDDEIDARVARKIDLLRDERDALAAEATALRSVVDHTLERWSPMIFAELHVEPFGEWTDDDWADSTWTDAEQKVIRDALARIAERDATGEDPA